MLMCSTRRCSRRLMPVLPIGVLARNASCELKCVGPVPKQARERLNVPRPQAAKESNSMFARKDCCGLKARRRHSGWQHRRLPRVIVCQLADRILCRVCSRALRRALRHHLEPALLSPLALLCPAPLLGTSLLAPPGSSPRAHHAAHETLCLRAGAACTRARVVVAASVAPSSATVVLSGGPAHQRLDIPSGRLANRALGDLASEISPRARLCPVSVL